MTRELAQESIDEAQGQLTKIIRNALKSKATLATLATVLAELKGVSGVHVACAQLRESIEEVLTQAHEIDKVLMFEEQKARSTKT